MGLLAEWQWDLILDYVQALVWPLLVGGILVYLLWRYGTQIGGLIDRLKSISAFGATAGFEPPTQQPNAVDEDAATETLTDEEGDSETLDALVAEYEERVAELQLQGEEKRKDLLRLVAVKTLQVEYERIYRSIFGSQIAALRSLRASPDEIAHRASLEAHLNQAKQLTDRVPFVQALEFDEWINFLIRHGLVIQREIDPDQYKLTSKGSGFLDYIEAGRYPSRPL